MRVLALNVAVYKATENNCELFSKAVSLFFSSFFQSAH